MMTLILLKAKNKKIDMEKKKKMENTQKFERKHTSKSGGYYLSTISLALVWPSLI